MSDHKCLSAALAAAQAEYPPIKKTSLNPHFKSSYADLADGMAPVRPILARHGIAYTQTFGVADGVLMLRTKLLHGSDVELSELPITQPPKPQDFISLTTYYRRVALFSILGITPVGDDDDGHVANATTTTQAPPHRRPPERVSPTAEVEAAIARSQPVEEPMLEIVKIMEGARALYTGSIFTEALRAYAAVKGRSADKLAVARANLDALKVLRDHATGNNGVKLQQEIEAAEATTADEAA